MIALIIFIIATVLIGSILALLACCAIVGTMDKWNDAKKAEERDRVRHWAKTKKGNNK